MREKNSTTRRGFLKVGAAAGVAAAAMPFAQADAADTPREMTEAGKGVAVANVQGMRSLGSGKQHMRVSAMGFGAMGMSHNRGVFPDRAASIAVIRQAAALGVNFFDTAQIYGPLVNEQLVGEALAPYRNEVMVATKFGFSIVDGKPQAGKFNSRPDNIRAVAEASLRRLNRDTIDLFYQHRPDPDVPVEDVAGAVQRLIKEGKVQRFGLCEVDADTIRRAHAIQPLTAVQSEYHLMWRGQETAVFPALEELGVGFVPYSPLNRGFLSGSINAFNGFGGGNDNRGSLPRFSPEALRANMAFVEVLNQFGRPRGATPAQVALAWLMSKKPWIVPIPGTTKMSHLEENLRSTELALSQSEVEELETRLGKVQLVGKHITT